MKLPWNTISALADAIMSKVFSSFHHYCTAYHILNTKINTKKIKFLLLLIGCQKLQNILVYDYKNILDYWLNQTPALHLATNIH